MTLRLPASACPVPASVVTTHALAAVPIATCSHTKEMT